MNWTFIQRERKKVVIGGPNGRGVGCGGEKGNLSYKSTPSFMGFVI